MTELGSYPYFTTSTTWVLVVKHLPANAGDLRDAGSIPESGQSIGEGYGDPLWYSCLENSMDRGAWQATVHRVPSVGHDLASKQSFFQISLRRKNAAN